MISAEGTSDMATRTNPSDPIGKEDLQKLPLAEVEKRLGSSPDGLTEAEATKRLAQYGPNEIPERRPTRCSNSSATSGARFPG
jgi:magnesium-transporting ATPase (P-type)